MGLILKLVVFLVVVGFLGLTGYAYLGDLSPERTEVHKPVDLTPVPANASQ
ncbi:hypothetical protein V8J36_09760 [Frigidibacter sp. MR17.14]|uniref:hypothetical protein n=1 Tax=Frigidibacter sp. MR17.14 TaxID=3126509 RepID=UPI003012AEDB